ncbi:hypothetical protein HDU97_010360 [Phlyctochytrium planicorne]|nr:hypothetical protein HDU97_010360 [Phlyctochytrium planicorne]
MKSLGRLHDLPDLVLTKILLIVKDLHISLVIESLLIDLPSTHPNVATAFDAIDAKANFPASLAIAKMPLFRLYTSPKVDAKPDFHGTRRLHSPVEHEPGIARSLVCASFVESVCPRYWWKDLTAAAVWHGKHRRVRFLMDRGILVPDVEMIRTAARLGDMKCVEMFAEAWRDDAEMTDEGARAAADAGHLETLMYFREHGKWVEPENEIQLLGIPQAWMNLGAKGGHFPVIEYLHESGLGGYSSSGLAMATASGNLEAVKYIHEMVGISFEYISFWDACATSSMPVIYYFLEHRDIDTLSSSEIRLAFQRASRLDSPEVIIFLSECFYDDTRLRDGELENLAVWIPKEDTGELEGAAIATTRWNTSNYQKNIHDAVTAGNLTAIMEAHHQTLMEDEHAFTWGKNIMNTAAEFGHLDIVKFLHRFRTDGCSTEAMDLAAAGGHLDVVEFLHDNRQEGCTVKAMDMAAQGGHFEIVQFLHKHRTKGCTVAAMDNAARLGDLEIVKFLHHNRTEGCTVKAIDYVGSLEVLEFLHKNRTEGCSLHAIGSVAHDYFYNTCKIKRGKDTLLRIVKYLVENDMVQIIIGSLLCAIQARDFEVFVYLHDRYRDRFIPLLVKVAVQFHGLKMLKYHCDHVPKDRMAKPPDHFDRGVLKEMTPNMLAFLSTKMKYRAFQETFNLCTDPTFIAFKGTECLDLIKAFSCYQPHLIYLEDVDPFIFGINGRCSPVDMVDLLHKVRADILWEDLSGGILKDGGGASLRRYFMVRDRNAWYRCLVSGIADSLEDTFNRHAKEFVLLYLERHAKSGCVMSCLIATSGLRREECEACKLV